MIVILMVSIAFAVDHMKQMEAEQERGVEIQNKVITQHSKHYFDLKIEYSDLEVRNKELERKIQRLLEERNALVELLKNKVLTIK